MKLGFQLKGDENPNIFQAARKKKKMQQQQMISAAHLQERLNPLLVFQ